MNKVNETIRSGKTYVGAVLGAVLAAAALLGLDVGAICEGVQAQAEAQVTE